MRQELRRGASAEHVTTDEEMIGAVRETSGAILQVLGRRILISLHVFLKLPTSEINPLSPGKTVHVRNRVVASFCDLNSEPTLRIRVRLRFPMRQDSRW